jgi:hypothetical protein
MFVQNLTSENVLEIARESVAELEQIVREDRELGYLTLQPLSGYLGHKQLARRLCAAEILGWTRDGPRQTIRNRK